MLSSGHKSSIIVLVCGLFLCAWICAGFENFQNDIPNGNNVENPCEPGGIWSGVGHLGPKGSGPRNAFGEDFAKANFRWTWELCMKDSDGDGVLNGAELGDPYCNWIKGAQTVFPITSHPGVCDPWDSPKCLAMNGSVRCEKEHSCPAVHEPDIEQIKMEFEPITVPKTDDSFFCRVYSLPNDTDYHMVAVKAQVQNHRVVNRITLYACQSSRYVSITNEATSSSAVSSVPCDQIITSYTPDFPVTCLHKDMGLLLGYNGIKQVLVQIHYSNPQQLDYTDESGLTLFFTKRLRINNAGIATLDSTVFEIPPGIGNYQVPGGCPSNCTQMRIISPVYVGFGLNYMHGLGTKQRVEVIRNEKVVHLLTDDITFNWKSPGIFRHADPLRVLPGDSLRMVCEYNSTGKTAPVSRGIESSDEMCRSQLIFYPQEAWRNPICLSFKHVPLCQFETTGSAFNCHYQSFIRSLSTDLLTNKDLEDCGRTRKCSRACLQRVAEEREHPCLQGELYELWKSNVVVNPDQRLVRLYSAMAACEKDYGDKVHLIPGGHGGRGPESQRAAQPRTGSSRKSKVQGATPSNAVDQPNNKTMAPNNTAGTKPATPGAKPSSGTEQNPSAVAAGAGRSAAQGPQGAQSQTPGAGEAVVTDGPSTVDNAAATTPSPRSSRRRNRRRRVNDPSRSNGDPAAEGSQPRSRVVAPANERQNTEARGPGVMQNRGPGVTQERGQGVTQERGQGVTQNRGQGVTQNRGPGVTQERGQGVTQERGQGVTQNRGQGPVQNRGQGVSGAARQGNNPQPPQNDRFRGSRSSMVIVGQSVARAPREAPTRV